MGRFLLVEEEADLSRFGTTHNAVVLTLQQANGVHCVVDLRSISPQTLCSFLMPESERIAHLGGQHITSPDHIIRAYWKGVRQPRLL